MTAFTAAADSAELAGGEADADELRKKKLAEVLCFTISFVLHTNMIHFLINVRKAREQAGFIGAKWGPPLLMTIAFFMSILDPTRKMLIGCGYETFPGSDVKLGIIRKEAEVAPQKVAGSGLRLTG